MDKQPPASLALTRLGIPHTIFRHTEQVTSLEQAAQERGQQPEQVVRSIVFRQSEEIFIMALMAGPVQISWPTLRGYLGQSRLTMATEEEVLLTTGYRVGTVSPFGLPRPMRILADMSVFQFDEISLGSGERNVGIIMKSADLQRGLEKIEIGKFASQP